MSKSTALVRWLPSWLAGRSSDGAKGMVHSGSGGGGLMQFIGASRLLPATLTDHEKEVGDGLGSSVLAGPLNFLARTFPEAPPIVQRRAEDQWEEDLDHPLTALLETPNPFYSGVVLMICTILDFVWGNAYWYKIRNAQGEVIQLWWIPRQLMTPRWPTNGTTFIDHYEYRPNGVTPIPLQVEDVVHFRFGCDPRNPRLGLSQLAALMREVHVDDVAANFTSAILKNLGIIGLVVSPKEKGTVATKDAVKALKEALKENFTGDKRGEPMAVGTAVDVTLLQYQMQNFDVGPIRDVSEERVCAALGLPAAVVGFGTGLQQTKVGATMKEMRQLAWASGVIPQQKLIATEIMRSLLPDFTPPGERRRVRFLFDTTQVRALWEDNNEKHLRVREDYKAGLIDRATALRETGRPTTEADVGVYSAAAKLGDDEPKNPADPATDPPTPPTTPPASDDDDDDEDEGANNP